MELTNVRWILNTCRKRLAKSMARTSKGRRTTNWEISASLSSISPGSPGKMEAEITGAQLS